MKVLDTPLLVDLLRGRLDVATLSDRADGEELATTELNLYELEVIGRLGPRTGRDRRLAVVQRLRRKLTVLAVDERACQVAAAAQAAHPRAASTLDWLVLGAAKAAGATEWWTVPREPVAALEGLEVVRISNHAPKMRK
jgi:predicted nucleic acid-binding protein